MAAQSQETGGLHAADAAADDGDLLFLLRRLQLQLLLPKGDWVQGAAAHTAVPGHPAGEALVPGDGEAAVMAGDAGADVLQVPGPDLIAPIRIAQELPGDAHAVHLAAGDGVRRDIRIVHAPRADHGDIHELLQVGHLRQIAGHGHIHGGMGPEPGVVGAVVRVQHIRAGLLQDPGGGGTLLHAAAELRIGFPRQGGLVEAPDLAGHAVPHGDGVILAAELLYLPDDVRAETKAVLQAAAVLVGTVVHVGHGELVQKVALVHGMDLHSVDARLLAEGGGFCVGLDGLLDLIDGEGPVLQGRFPDVGHPVAGCDQHLLPDLLRHFIHARKYHLGTAEAGAQLEEEFGAVGVDIVHEPLHGAQEQVPLLIEPAVSLARGAHVRHAGDHEAHIGLGPGNIIVPVALAELAFKADGVGSPHGAQDDPVFQGDAPHLQRGEQRLVIL